MTKEDLDLELLDIAFDAYDLPLSCVFCHADYMCSCRQDFLVLLASFNAGLEDESGMDTRPRRFYVVVRMKREDHLEVASIRTVPYQTVSESLLATYAFLNKGLLWCRYLRTERIFILAYV